MIFGYVDPTSGGFLLQVLLGGSAIVVVIRTFLGDWLRRVFRRGEREDLPPRP